MTMTFIDPKCVCGHGRSDHAMEQGACSRNADLVHHVETCKCHRFNPSPTARRNGGQLCDTTSGPCACGAWH